ncbi:MAG TPA: hypothetical protein PKY81_01415 [bacterium]|nr:hypothetical protein [bacterium]HPN29593.1 hypothetical protein [bacterium]
MENEFIIKCPCCSANLIIDKETGKVLKHESVSQQKAQKSFEELLAEQEDKKKQLNSKFDMLFDQEKNKKELVDKEFEKAKSKFKGKNFGF